MVTSSIRPGSVIQPEGLHGALFRIQRDASEAAGRVVRKRPRLARYAHQIRVELTVAVDVVKDECGMEGMKARNKGSNLLA